METNVLDLFCGAGGFSLGFEQEGFNILLGADKWEDAINTYRHNHNSVGINTDLSDISPDSLPVSKEKVDVIIGGPPCKGFSLSGQRDPEDERNQLVPRFIDFVEHYEPDVAVMENVVGIMSMEDGDVIEYICERYEDMGYNIEYKTLKCENYGIPQTRHRVFFVATSNGNTPQFPDETTSNTKVPVSEVLEKDFSNHPDHELTNHSDDMVSRISDVGYGESLYDNYTEAWKRLNPNEPAPTIKENHGAPFIHYEFDRVGSPRECSAIQTFPDWFKFKGSKSSKLKQIGNAVPPELARKQAKVVKNILD